MKDFELYSSFILRELCDTNTLVSSYLIAKRQIFIENTGQIVYYQLLSRPSDIKHKSQYIDNLFR